MYEKALEKGLQEGRERGFEQGIEKGIEKYKIEQSMCNEFMQLKRRFLRPNIILEWLRHHKCRG